MSGREASLKLSITVSSNTGTGTLTNRWEVVPWIRVIPVAETDSYDLTIQDADGHIMAKRTGQIGTFSEQLRMSLGIMRSILIENATQDGTYTAKLDMH